jgi:hypothetical protein
MVQVMDEVKAGRKRPLFEKSGTKTFLGFYTGWSNVPGP